MEKLYMARVNHLVLPVSAVLVVLADGESVALEVIRGSLAEGVELDSTPLVSLPPRFTPVGLPPGEVEVVCSGDSSWEAVQDEGPLV